VITFELSAFNLIVPERSEWDQLQLPLPAENRPFLAAFNGLKSPMQNAILSL